MQKLKIGILVLVLILVLISCNSICLANDAKKTSQKLQNTSQNQSETTYGFTKIKLRNPAIKLLPSMMLSISFGSQIISPALIDTGNGIKNLVSRYGFYLGPMIIFGGEGLGFELQTRFLLQNSAEIFGKLFGTELYTGLYYRIVKGRTIINLGFGLLNSYLLGSEIEYGLESYARIPFGVAHYPSKRLAIFFELAIIGGYCYIKREEMTVLGNIQANSAAGIVVGGDFALGLQFP